MSEGKGIDPLTLSLIEGRLNSLNEEVGERILRQCFSIATAHIRDLGTVLFDKHERTITTGSYIAVHTGGSHVCLKGILDWIGRDNIHPDDFIIANDPFIVRFGHAPDWSFLRPIFYKGELVFYHYVRTHQYDSGGAFMGCYFPRTYDCHGEGIMIPPVKIIEQGKVDEKAYSIILRNVRGSHVVRADNMLIYASMRKAEERLLDMLKAYGKDVVLAACDQIIGKTEEAARRAISGFAAGTYYAERAADWDGTTDRPVWVRLALTVKPDKGQLIFDFSESDPMCDFINIPVGQVWSCMGLAVIWALMPGTPFNQGLINCIKVITKEGTALDPVYPATSGSQACMLGNEVVEVAQLALSQVAPKESSGLWARHFCPILTGKWRPKIDPRTGSVQSYWTAPFHGDGGSGATYGYDGVDQWCTALGAGGMIRAALQPEEWMVPYRWLCYELQTDSAGDGQWRGGLGTHVEHLNTHNPEFWQPLDHVVMTGNSDGEKFGSLGIEGGTEGNKNKLHILRGGKKVPLRTVDVQYVEPGDLVVTKSGGGGGWGDPLDRKIESVRQDVMNEYISVGKAKKVYGVVMDPRTFEVDYEATARLRKKLKAGKTQPKRGSSILEANK